ncbi:hypothetical protein GF389_04485 [Candidatus Dojkabacteria bacterium]|nr:hypothetical protein [Candidatus Dojkabacteria bacterium]
MFLESKTSSGSTFFVAISSLSCFATELSIKPFIAKASTRFFIPRTLLSALLEVFPVDMDSLSNIGYNSPYYIVWQTKSQVNVKLMKLSQSTIFHTNTNQKEEIARYILELISSTENNPDYLEIGVGDKQSIGIKQIKELISWIQTRPYQEKNKVAVILGAEKMTTESQSSLLKVLEEPPARSYILLATTNPRSLLDTVRSRATLIHVIQETKIELSPSSTLSSFLSIDLQEQVRFMEEIKKIKTPKEKKEAIRQLLDQLHTHILKSSDISRSSMKSNLKLLKQTETALNTNTNTKLLLENLFFNFRRI